MSKEPTTKEIVLSLLKESITVIESGRADAALLLLRDALHWTQLIDCEETDARQAFKKVEAEYRAGRLSFEAYCTARALFENSEGPK